MRLLIDLLTLFIVLNFYTYLCSGFFWHKIRDISREIQELRGKIEGHHHCSLWEIFYDSFLGGNPYVKLIRKIFFKDSLFRKSLVWERTKQPLLFPAYKTTYNGRELYVRVNNFPEEHLYTLMEGIKDLVSFDDWPDKWQRH